MTTSSTIIVGGRAHRCDAPVHSWLDTGFHFVCPMRKSTRFVVTHWTGAENGAEQVFGHMKAGRLSVHFLVDQLGEIYQCADADARCAHAVEGGGNIWGVGIEVINRGHSMIVPTKGYVRTRRTEVIHRRAVEYGEFFPAQVASVVALNASLCDAYDLELRVPMKAGDVYPTVLPTHYLAAFRGCLGHFHLDRGKLDPGLELMRRIHGAGRHGDVA